MRAAGWLVLSFVACLFTVNLATAGGAALPAARHACALEKGERTNLEFDSQKRLRLKHQEGGYTKTGEFLSEPIDLGAARTVQLDWIEQWTAPQLWKRHPGNPIYGPGKSGAWDNWTNGVSIVKTDGDRKYRMYYAGKGPAGIGFAEAIVADPITWKEHPSSPVIKPRADNWEGNRINQPRVVKVTETHWRMYYTGWGYKGSSTSWGMGVAESFDAGITWKRYQDETILSRGDMDSPDGGGACVPMVLKVGDKWMMWYTAAMATPGKQNIHLCLATSADGLKWNKYEKNPVLTDDFTAGGNRVVISRCFVRHDQGVFRMWYSFAKPQYRICYAESLNGIDWERSPVEPVLGPSPVKAWDDQMVEYPEVDIIDGKFRLWFCGNGFGSVGFAEGIPECFLDLAVRSRGDEANAWSDWELVARNERKKVARYIQARVHWQTANPKLSPTLNRLTILPVVP